MSSCTKDGDLSLVSDRFRPSTFHVTDRKIHKYNSIIRVLYQIEKSVYKIKH